MTITSPPVLLGIDLGGTKIEIIALDTKGQSLYRTRTHTPKHDNPSQQYDLIIQQIAQLVSDCEATINVRNCPIGIGIPGSESLATGLIKNANTTCLIGRPFRQDLSHHLQRPIKLENDANCFALSEAVDGAGAHHTSVFAVILGTGVGGGWVINNQLIVGPNHICGEWGHNPLPWPNTNDEPKQTCYCGKTGCIETYLSGPGMRQQAALQFELNMSSHDIMAQRSTHPSAQKSYDNYIHRLAKSLASVINIMDPEIIVLGGGLSNIDSLYSDVPNIWGEYVFSDEVKTKLVKNQYGDSSGVRGAAWLNRA
ncbi:MAG: fructokinase [Oceanicoccus sp.]|jgi:fructokinase